MNEYQYNVSYLGQFLFRTEWDTDAFRIHNVMTHLCDKFPVSEGYKISQHTRSNVYHSQEVQ